MEGLRQKGDQAGSRRADRDAVPPRRFIKNKGKIQKIRLGGARHSRKPARLPKLGFGASAGPIARRSFVLGACI